MLGPVDGREDHCGATAAAAAAPLVMPRAGGPTTEWMLTFGCSPPPLGDLGLVPNPLTRPPPLLPGMGRCAEAAAASAEARRAAEAAPPAEATTTTTAGAEAGAGLAETEAEVGADLAAAPRGDRGL